MHARRNNRRETRGRPMRRHGGEGRMAVLSESIRAGRTTYGDVLWAWRYPSAIVASIGALATLLYLVVVPYLTLWLALVVVFLSWVAGFMLMMAAVTSWYNSCLGKGDGMGRDWDDREDELRPM